MLGNLVGVTALILGVHILPTVVICYVRHGFSHNVITFRRVLELSLCAGTTQKRTSALRMWPSFCE